MSKEPDFPIDFVIPWVNGSDPLWLNKKAQYQSKTSTEGNSNQRFEDFGTLKYLFRSIEKYANWVNVIWLITDQQVPEWLAENSRVQVVDHRDYIPQRYLPTFNSNVIELNVWRIADLTDHFVLLNDDLLFVSDTKKSDFFSSKGAPKDIAAQSVFMPRDDFAHIPVNNISLINQQFNKRDWLIHNWQIAFNFRNGVGLNILSLLLSPLPYITRFFEPHVGTAYLKSSFIKVWELFPEKLELTSQNKFRDINEVSHWLVRYYQIMTGQIRSRSHHFGRYFSIMDDSELQRFFRHPTSKMIVLNDDYQGNYSNKVHVETSMKLLQIFLNEKSEYERH